MTDQNSAIILEREPGASGAALPVCLAPWIENPYGLVSLWDMLQVHARRFVTLLDDLGRLKQQSAMGLLFQDQTVTGSVLSAVRQDCTFLELISASKQVEKIHDIFAVVSAGKRKLSWPEWTTLIAELHERVEEDLEEAVFFQVKAEAKGTCFVRSRNDGLTDFSVKTAEQYFGDRVVTSFPSAAFDIGESCRCVIASRGTACVFHLMRVLEIGLTVFAVRFNVPADHTNWHNIIEGIEKAVRVMGSDPNRAPDWKDQQEFFSQAATHFMFFKEAWRNYTAHVRGKYTEEEAASILGNVRGFMQKLAARLHE